MMADLIGRPLYSLTMVRQLLGLSEMQVQERIDAGKLPKPIKHNRWDARAIDKIYWDNWGKRKRFQSFTEE